MELIQEGIDAHKAGEKYVDPLTGRSVAPVPQHMSDEEQDERWLLDHFSKAKVSLYAETHSVDKIVSPALMALGTGVTLFVGSIITIAVTVSWLDDPKNAWLPVVACVVAGALLTHVIYTSITLVAARKLGQSQLFSNAGFISGYLARVGPKPEGLKRGFFQAICCWCFPCLRGTGTAKDATGNTGHQDANRPPHEFNATEGVLSRNREFTQE
jgi:hypothetical protein